MTEKKEADDKKAEETKAATPAKKADTKPTGKEHWGEGGEFYINNEGRRVRKPVPKQSD